MNAEQRTQLQKALDILAEVKEQEQSKVDNTPENLMNSEKYEKMQENVDSLQEAEDLIQQVMEG